MRLFKQMKYQFSNGCNRCETEWLFQNKENVIGEYPLVSTYERQTFNSGGIALCVPVSILDGNQSTSLVKHNQGTLALEIHAPMV